MNDINDVKASAYSLASEINQKIIADMAREFEVEQITNGIVPPSIIKQRKADEMKLSEQKNSSRYNRISEGIIICEKGEDMPPYALQIMDILQSSDVREIRYSGNKISIISGKLQKTFEIEGKRGKIVGIKYKKKGYVEI